MEELANGGFGAAGLNLSNYLKAKHVLDVRDLWPETPIALGKISKYGIIAFFLRLLEKILYKNANLVVVTSPGYIQHIKKIAKKSNPHVILNGIDEIFKTESVLIPLSLRKNEEVPKKILYAGNIGIAQNLVTIINAAFKLQKEKFEFILIGSGTQLALIKELVKKKNLTNVTILPPMNRAKLLYYYQSVDAFYLQLHSNEYFNKVIPSKIFEYLSFEKPIIFGLEGVSKNILNSYAGTYYVKPDLVNSLVNVLYQVDFSVKINRDVSSLKRDVQIDKYATLIETTMGGEK
jgi:glycosyltransferase involved in cell wall biosynthesis